MSLRRLLLIDSDDEFHRQLHDQLTPYGFEIYKLEETPEALAQVREIKPELIFIAVEEPDKVGYSLCNKAKKGVAKKIPVVLTTRSVPKKGFNSHRKLKVHADEYLDKRSMTADELLGKVDGLVKLGELVRESLEIPVDVEEMSIDDIEVEEEELVVDDIDVDEIELSASEIELDFEDGGEKTTIAAPQMLIDDGIDQATNAAFAMLTDDPAMDEEPAPLSSPPAVPSPDPIVEDNVIDLRPVADSEPKPPPPQPEPEPTVEAAPPPKPEPPPAPEPEATPDPVTPKPEPTADADDGLDLGLDQVVEMATEEQATPQNIKRMRSLEEENARLKNELDAALSASAGTAEGSSSREREFLNLRKEINDKQQEILNLRDDIGLKDRQILDGKERIRQLDHTKAKFDAKNLELEQQILEAGDEQKTVVKERDTVKSQLADVESQLTDVKSELTAATTKAAKDASAAAQALTAANRAHTEELTGLQAAKEDALSAAKTAQETTVAQLSSEHNAANEQLKIEHTQQLATHIAEAEAKHTEEIAALAAAHESAQTETADKTEAAHQAVVTALETAHKEALAALVAEHKSAVDTREAETAEELRNLLQQNKSDHQSLKDQHSGHLARIARERTEGIEAAQAEAKVATQNALDRAEEARVADLASAAEERAAAENALQERFSADKAALEQNHTEAIGAFASERDELETALGSTRESIKQLDDKLVVTEKAVTERDEEIERLKDTIGRRDGKITSLKTDIEELEAQNASYQEQVLKAYQKIKTDEAIVTKAKKAVAIALTLLDDTTSD